MIGVTLTELKSSVLKLHDRFENYLPALFFSGGFGLDVMTLGDVDELSNIIILSIYLITAVLIMSFEIRGIETYESQNNWVKKAFHYRDDAFHFCLGALLSAFTLFYFKSSSLANSFFFLLAMVLILLLNETPLFQKNGIIVRSILIMLALVSYLILMVPMLVGRVNIFVFSLSLICAFALSFFSFWLLSKNNRDKRPLLKNLLYPQLLVVIVFVLLYWLKILPPVPLSIKSIGIYHNVIKENGEYLVETEKPKWKFWLNGDQEFYAEPGDKVYVAASVFSPAGFQGKVFLHFLKESADGWQTSDRIPIRILGGRKKGFRGYAFKENYLPGNWQVRIETASDLEIGRINFEIIPKDPSSEGRFFRRLKF